MTKKLHLRREFDNTTDENKTCHLRDLQSCVYLLIKKQVNRISCYLLPEVVKHTLYD